MGSKSEEVNVRVAIRCRPLNAREENLKSSSCVEFNGPTITLVDLNHPGAKDDPSSSGSGPSAPANKARRNFTFDYAYDPDSEQETVYTQLAKPILDRAIEGYNATIFAYGQTGSGKTFTMRGYGDNPGIITRLTTDLFQRAANAPANKKYLITCSYVEIYMDELQDLLNPNPDKVLRIREHQKLGIYVEGVAELVVKSASEMVHLIDQGDKIRSVGETKMNKTSSRSHAVFIIKVQCKTLKDPSLGEKTGASAKDERQNVESLVHTKINLVDLAGSERIEKTEATGVRLEEAKKINLSLSALGNVIEALASKKPFVPYRDSPLTRMLQESLGGNALTCMITAISPAFDNYNETLSSLQYADRAKQIKNSMKKNEDSSEALIRDLRAEVERLRQQLSRSVNDNTAKSSLAEIEDRMRELEMAKQQSWEEKERLSRMFEKERQDNLNRQGLLDVLVQSLRQENEDLQRQIEDLQRQRKEAEAVYERLKDDTRTLRDAYEQEVEEFKVLEKQGKLTEADKKQRLLSISEKKRRIKDLGDRLLEQRKEVQRLKKDDLRAHQAMMISENSQLRKVIQENERNKIESENAKFLEKERTKMLEELDLEKQKVRLKMSERNVVSKEEYAQLEEEYSAERAQKQFLLAKVNVLENEKDMLSRAVEDEAMLHEVVTERQQLQYFRIFRQYREAVEEDFQKREENYMRIIEQSVADALHLSTRVSDLELDNERLRQRLRDLNLDPDR